MDINEILMPGANPQTAISALKKKTVIVPPWSDLVKEYDPRLHPVMTDPNYRDKVTKKNGIEKVTRTILGWQKLATKRITELMFSTPVRRVYSPENEHEALVAKIMEAIFRKNRIDALNIERGRALFASCESVTIWYSQEYTTEYAKNTSSLKLRCKCYSPMNGDGLYPLFDEYDDLIALSIEYRRVEDSQTVTYFETYTDTLHIRWRINGGAIEEDLRESIELGKIPGVYINRPEPVWEDQSDNVYEAEWTLSRNGNYIRKNARPNWVIFSDEKSVTTGKEPASDNAGRNVLRYGRNDKAGYVTWQQAIDSIKFHTEMIKQNYFMVLQLPDMSMDSMKATPMSGEARKMLFLDAQMKVTDESGIWLEMFDREINVVRAFMKKMYPSLSAAIDSLAVDVIITPFQIRDKKEIIENLTAANGNKAIMSQRESIQELGWSDDVDRTMREIREEERLDALELAE